MEVTILNWTLFAGILASLGAIAKVIFDNRNLATGQKDITSQSQRLKNELANDHDKLLHNQNDARQTLTRLDTTVSNIKRDIEESNRRLESLNGSEKNAKSATDILNSFIEQTKKERLELENQIKELEDRVVSLSKENERLRSLNNNKQYSINHYRDVERNRDISDDLSL